MSIFNFCIDLTVVLLNLRISNQLYMSMVQRLESGSISSRSLVQIYPSDFGVWTIFLKLRILAFICNMWVTQNVLFEKEYLPCLWTFFFLCASYLKLFLPSTSRTMALEVVFLGTFFSPLSAKEGLFRNLSSSVLIPSSVTGSLGHLSRSQSHFQCSFDWRHQPQRCAGSGLKSHCNYK